MSKSLDRLIMMANQIGRAFVLRPEDEVVHEVAYHIKSFWEARMLAQIYAHMDAGGTGLDPLVRQGLEYLRDQARVKA
jgi:formate dehydrogenase subunit delta